MFKNIWDWITRGFKSVINWLRPKASTAINIINAIKTTVENPVVGYIVSITPTKADDAAMNALKVWLPKVAEEMLVAEKVLQAGNSAETIINTLIDYLRTKSKEARAKWWTELQGRLTVYLADGKISLQEAMAIGQMIYKEISTPALATAA